jgi:PKD repeat protein
MVYDANSRDQMSFTFGGDGQNDSWLWRTNDWGAVQFIQGQVMNATTGSPIAGANVTDGIRWAITDATGEYNLTEPSGSYILTATAPGYYAGSASVTVSSDNPGQNFDLVPTLTAVASASPTSGRAPLKVTFTGSVRGGVAPCTYSWRYGDGGKSSDLSPTHTYNASGNYTAKFWVNDSASHSVGSMVAVTVTAPIPRPNITSFTVSPASVVVGGNVTFSVSVTGGMLPLNYSYSNLPTGCKSSNTTHLLCSPTGAGKFRTVVTVTDSERRTVNASATLNVTVPIGPPTITSFAASPASIVLGDSTTLTVEATGGTTPYSISYFDLPPGCLSSNTSELTCIPSAAGVYAIGVYVNDTSGHSVTSATTLTVHPTGWGSGPTITGFSASPSAEDVVGTTVMMTVQASGGTGALTYRYTGLPPGCSSTNSSTLSCSLPEVGNYTVRVYVNDSDGHSASTTLTLTATPPLATTLLANRTQLYAGGSIELSEFTTGGVAPYALSWSMNGTNTTYAGTSWALTLAHSGNYTFAVWAKDAHGNVAASQRVKVQVLPAPPGKVTTVVSQSQPYPWWWLLVLLVFGVVAVLIVVILLVRRRHTDRNGSAKVSVAVATADASLAPPNAPKVHTEAPAVVPAERVEGAEEPALGAHPASVASALAASEPVSAQREALAPSPQLSKGTHVQFEGTIGQERTEESPFEGDIKPEEVNPNVQHLDPKLLQPMEMRITQDRGSDVRETEPEKDSDTRAKELLERAQRSRSKRKSKFGVEQAPKPEKSDEK